MRAILLFVVIALTAVGGGAAVSAGGEAGAARDSELAANSACGTLDFDRYDAGAAVAGIPKTDTMRRCEPDVGAPSRINMVAAIYGNCEPVGTDGGCSPPLQVQSWPACERNLGLYEKYPSPDGASAEYAKTRIRGVPAAVFDGGRRIEVFTGDVTIVVFGRSSALTNTAAVGLSGLHGDRVVGVTEQLPAPVDGALEGKLRC